MCAAQSNSTTNFGYTWGFADNPRAESVVEISPNINYTVSEPMPYLQLTDSGGLVQKDSKGAITHTNKGGVVRRMYVVNDSFPQGTTQRVITTGSPSVTTHKKHDVLSMGCDKNCSCNETTTTAITPIFIQSDQSNHSIANGIIDSKSQTVLTTSGKTTHFMSPIGPLQLTAEECNEILMKRAMASAQQNQHTITTTSDGHHAGISVQVQKVIQGLEDAEDSQATSSTHCKLEPVLSISPKLENEGTPNPTTPKERPYSCEECGKSFLLKHHLTTHARVHTGERPHICVHCGKSFAHKHCLNTHLLLHSTDRPYQCNECKKSFTLKHHLLTHSRVHSRDRPFICPECGRSFPLKRHLVTHSKFHAGERPFVCEDCGESFAQKDHLVMHSRFHGSLNPFACPDCGATFPRKFQLVNHGRIHGRVPHSCTICGKEFLQKRTLVAHMRLHTGDQPYPCTACGEGFRTKAEMNQHNRLQHGGINPNSANTTIVTNVVQQNQQHHQQQQTVTVVSNSNNGMVIPTASTPDTSPRPQYGCRECGSAFNSREALALHLRLHTGDKGLMTDLCALTAAIPGHFLNTNLNQVPVQIITSSGQVVSQTMSVQSPPHQTTTVVTSVPPQQKPKSHFCSSCSKGFASKHGLFQHNKRHPNGGCAIRQHVCDNCGKAFFQKNHLMLHQRQHLETKHNTGQNNQQQQNQQQQQESMAQQQQQQMNQLNQSQQQQQHNHHSLSTRELVISNQPVQVQVLQGGNTAQVIKYEINIPQDSHQSIE